MATQGVQITCFLVGIFLKDGLAELNVNIVGKWALSTRLTGDLESEKPSRRSKQALLGVHISRVPCPSGSRYTGTVHVLPVQ